MIDSHQHFWSYDPVLYNWIEPGKMEVLRRDFLPLNLAPILQSAGIKGTIAVQARQDMDETMQLLSFADQNPFILGVVGWTDLRNQDLDKNLTVLNQQPNLVGFREILQGQPSGTMLDPVFIEGVKRLHSFGLTYDILVFENQLKEVIEFVTLLHQDQPLVLDHLGKPDIRQGNISEWGTMIREIALHQNVYCKLSGLVTETHWDRWQEKDLIPYLEIVLDAFGADRCMYGSDWPVCLCAAEDYQQVLDIVLKFSAQLPDAEQKLVFSETCKSFYKV